MGARVGWMLPDAPGPAPGSFFVELCTGYRRRAGPRVPLLRLPHQGAGAPGL